MYGTLLYSNYGTVITVQYSNYGTLQYSTSVCTCLSVHMNIYQQGRGIELVEKMQKSKIENILQQIRSFFDRSFVSQLSLPVLCRIVEKCRQLYQELNLIFVKNWNKHL